MTPLAGQSNSPFPKPIKKVILSLHPTSQTSPVPPTPSSPAPPTYPIDPIALDILTRELPHVGDGQVPLSEVLSRVVQDTYARFVELVDILPKDQNERKRAIGQWTVDSRRQIVKTYSVFKWASLVAEDVQKSMNITQFLINHNSQFDYAATSIAGIKDILGPARLRNADILSALSLLTSPISSNPATQPYSSYDPPILPTIIHQAFKSPPRLTNAQIREALTKMDDVLRFRLRFAEIIPTEMKEYSIANGRVTFTCPSLFTASFSLTGRDPEDIWYALDFKFLLAVRGRYADITSGMFPTTLPPKHWAELLPGINAQLALYGKTPDMSLDLTSDFQPLPAPPPAKDDQEKTEAEREKEKEEAERERDEKVVRESVLEIVDAPLVRAFNLLQLLSLSYQLEILHHQASQLRGIGWLDYLRVEVFPGRRQLTVSYWMRKPPPQAQQSQQQRPSQAPTVTYGGTLTISISSTPPQSLTSSSSPSSSPSKFNTHVDKMARLLEEKCKLGVAISSSKGKGKEREVEKANENERAVSDQVEKLWLVGKWERVVGALGVRAVGKEKEAELVDVFVVDSQNLDFEAIMRSYIIRHSRWILSTILDALKTGPSRRLFDQADEVSLIEESGIPTLRLRLHSDEYLYISLDARTGKFLLRDAGDLAAWGRGRKYARHWEVLNEMPGKIVDAIVRLRFQTILDALEHEALYMGLRGTRHGGLTRQELSKLGTGSQGFLFIKVSNLDDHFLVFIITEEGFRQALVHVRKVREQEKTIMVISAIAWLDMSRIRGWNSNEDDEIVLEELEKKRKRGDGDVEMIDNWDGGDSSVKQRRAEDGSHILGGSSRTESFTVDPKDLRELYAFCCARVAFVNLQTQLKSHNIPCIPVFRHRQTRSDVEGQQSIYPVPALGIRAEDIWTESSVAIGNLKMDILDWWSERKCKVVTTVQLKPALTAIIPKSSTKKRKGKEKETHVSRRFTFDPAHSRISFLSYDVENAVDDFLREWGRVERMCRIARDVAAMQKQKSWDGVRLLFFDFETVKIAYVQNFTVAIRWVPTTYFPTTSQIAQPGGYVLSFGCDDSPAIDNDEDVDAGERWNPHEDASGLFAKRLQGEQKGGIKDVIFLLRETLPILLELEEVLTPKNHVKSEGGSRKPRVELLVKGVVWCRVVYSSKYAVDFRLQSGGQVSVVDASHTANSPGGKASTSKDAEGFTPIPGFSDIVKRVVASVVKDRSQLDIPGKGEGAKPASPPKHRSPILVDVGDGILCSVGVVFSVVCKRLHEAISDSVTV